MNRSRVIALFILLTAVLVSSQNPHGDKLQQDCIACHQAEGWDIPSSFWQAAGQEGRFSHETTGFSLDGQHGQVDCRACHATLVFSEASADCVSCHTDMHRMTVGDDCRRCHNTDSWLVDNIMELHFDNGFPLLGAHTTANCNACHVSESGLEFHRIGNACINCHNSDFASTTNPNHIAAGYSIQCTDCHRADAFDWSAQNIAHDFFPLTQGHEIMDCRQCHQTNNYSDTSPVCVSCHLTDYQTAQNPNHQASGFPTDCALCHTTAPGWRPATFVNHDEQFFPINSGNHRGEWNACTDCHTTPGNYSLFSCVDCHEHNNQSELARDHRDVNGYVFLSTACYACHPRGEE